MGNTTSNSTNIEHITSIEAFKTVSITKSYKILLISVILKTNLFLFYFTL